MSVNFNFLSAKWIEKVKEEVFRVQINKKKRKFRGNQHTVEEDASFTSASAAKSLNAFFSKLLFSTRLIWYLKYQWTDLLEIWHEPSLCNPLSPLSDLNQNFVFYYLKKKFNWKKRVKNDVVIQTVAILQIFFSLWGRDYNDIPTD